MATLIFANKTLWNDAAGGIGPAQVSAPTEATQWNIIRLNGGGKVAQDTGAEAGSVTVRVQYVLTPAQFDTLLSDIAWCKGKVGALKFPIGAVGKTINNCVMLRPSIDRGEVMYCNNVEHYRVFGEFIFEVLF